MELSYDEIKQLIRDSVEEALEARGSPPNCPINCGNGLTPAKHKYHHQIVEKIDKDITKIRTSFIVGILMVALGGAWTIMANVFDGVGKSLSSFFGG